jgi:hypothetical protein
MYPKKLLKSRVSPYTLKKLKVGIHQLVAYTVEIWKGGLFAEEPNPHRKASHNCQLHNQTFNRIINSSRISLQVNNRFVLKISKALAFYVFGNKHFIVLFVIKALFHL